MSAVLFAALLAGNLPSFSIDDQFQRRHSAEEVFGGDRVTVIVAGDERKSGEAIRDWLRALKLPSSVRAFGFVNLDGLPFFVPNQSVRDNLIELLPKTPVLCDFEGDTYEALRLPEAEASVHVFYRKKQVGSVTGAPDKNNAARVLSLVRTATRS